MNKKEEIDRRRSVGVGVSPLDYYSGVALEPGYRRHMARQPLVYKAIGRGGTFRRRRSNGRTDTRISVSFGPSQMSMAQ